MQICGVLDHLNGYKMADTGCSNKYRFLCDVRESALFFHRVNMGTVNGLHFGFDAITLSFDVALKSNCNQIQLRH